MSNVLALYGDGPIPGSIVNLGSILGRDGTKMMSHYSASKAAVENFTKSAAKEFARFVATSKFRFVTFICRYLPPISNHP